VEVELKEELEFVIVQLLNLEVTTVRLMAQWIWKLNHAMKTLALSMEDGENGVNGMNVRCLVEERTKEEQEYVIILRHNLEVTTAQLTDLLIQKFKDAMKIPVQLMEDLAIGMNGDHALHNVEEETKQDQEDAIILSLNLVDWNAMVILLNANAVTWIHAHLHAQHNI